MRHQLFGAVVLACVAIACGGGTDNPVAPSNNRPVTTAPPSPSFPNLAGTWSGTHEMQFSGQRTFSNISVTLTQTDRIIRGTWRLTSPGWDINGNVDLTILGDGASARLTGTGTLVGETSTGTGRCTGSFGLNSEGTISSNSLRLVGPNITLTNCRNTVGGIVWIVSK